MMKKKTLLIFVLFSMLLSFTPTETKAQGETPRIVGATIPVSEGVRAATLELIRDNPPAASPFYGITAVSQYNGGYAVSIAALSAAKDESQGWYLGDGEFEWLGSVYVYSDSGPKKYKAEYLSAPPNARKVAIPRPAPGGHEDVALPIASGSCAIYSQVGVTSAGYGTYGSGMYAIDLITGRDIQTNAAPPQAYASGLGEIDFVCYSEEVVMVKTYNSLLNDYFIYGNLEPGNVAHVVGHEYTSANQLVGDIVQGSFDGSDGIVNCGSSSQSPTRATLRWGFVPANGYYTVESYKINIISGQIDFDGKTINPGDSICSGAGWTGGSWDSPSGRVQSGVANFFDLFVVGIANMVNAAIRNTLPEHNASMGDFLLVASNTAKVVFKIAYVMFRGNINLGPIMAVAAFWLAVFAIWGAIRLVLLVFQFVRLVLLR